MRTGLVGIMLHYHYRLLKTQEPRKHSLQIGTVGICSCSDDDALGYDLHRIEVCQVCKSEHKERRGEIKVR